MEAAGSSHGLVLAGLAALPSNSPMLLAAQLYIGVFADELSLRGVVVLRDRKVSLI